MKHTKLVALCESALLLALAVVLSYIKFFELPFDGSITLFSMLPICLIAIKYGWKWGLGTAFCFSWFQILQGGVFGWGLTPVMLIGSLLLDYILAYTVLGFAGIFRKKGYFGMLGGIAMVCVLRFLVHFLAGIILWANFEQFVAFGQEWVNRPVLYSICYNGVYMLPETILTVAVAAILLKIPQIKRLITAPVAPVWATVTKDAVKDAIHEVEEEKKAQEDQK
ncbi:MAG: energy-coupled thiamine transporter ThiT [Clostridia bacterium]|nr:energy-coupled thiamine transporter ThiT [Clostridia bacterium]